MAAPTSAVGGDRPGEDVADGDTETAHLMIRSPPSSPPNYDGILSASQRIRGRILRSPLVPLNDFGLDVGALGYKVWLKLECLQPSGSFKWRGAWNALLSSTSRRHARRDGVGGVCTASAGNFGRALAVAARQLSIPCTVVVPEHAPAAKTEPIAAAGARVVRVPYDDWWKAIVDRCWPPAAAVGDKFIHPVSPEVMCGNGTIGLEVYEDLPEVDVVIAPYGGGGLAAGLALALQQVKPSVRVYASEVASAAPLRAALEAGSPVNCPYAASFVDGIGGRSVLADMWPLVSRLIAGSIVVSVEQVAAAVRSLATGNGVVAEGAGASSLAAALIGHTTLQLQEQQLPSPPRERCSTVRNVVCIVTGSNIDCSKLASILHGQLP